MIFSYQVTILNLSSKYCVYSPFMFQLHFTADEYVIWRPNIIQQQTLSKSSRHKVRSTEVVAEQWP